VFTFYLLPFAFLVPERLQQHSDSGRVGWRRHGRELKSAQRTLTPKHRHRRDELNVGADLFR
jgi:hypothetical protein